MFIAKQKKNENIAEYLLYMWQLEDMLRALHLDIDKIQEALIDPTDQSVEKKEEAHQWYRHIIDAMKAEGVEHEGHIEENIIILSELSDLHAQLLKNADESHYREVYYKTLPYIVELRAKSKDKEVSEMETCFTALYGYLLLKLQKKDVSSDTASAISQISSLLALLSERYKSHLSKE